MGISAISMSMFNSYDVWKGSEMGRSLAKWSFLVNEAIFDGKMLRI